MNTTSEHLTHVLSFQQNYLKLAKSYLEKYDFFNLCTLHEQKNIIQNITIKQYYNNQLIYKKNTTATDIIIILKGAIKLIWITSNGKNVIQNIIPFGELLHITTATNNAAFLHDHVAHDTTIVATIPTDVLNMILKSNHAALFSMFQLICLRFYSLNERLYYNATETLRIRIIRQIIIFVENFSEGDYKNKPSTIRFSQESFADLLQTSRQSINKELSWLTSEKLSTLNTIKFLF